MKKLKLFFLMQLFLAAAFVSVAQKNANGWTDLFDGKTFSGWKKLAGTADYKIENGMMVGTTVVSSPNTFLVTEKEYGDFVLELEVKIEDSTSNSGIQFRSHFNAEANDGKGKVYGYQYELDPSSRRWTAGIYDEGRRDWIYPLSLNATAQKAFRLGGFNKVHIECAGHELKTWINGVPAAYMVDTFDTKGFIALQVHSIGDNAKLSGEKIYWKNIRIKTGSFKQTAFPKDVYVLNNIPNYLCNYEKNNGWKLLFDGVSNNGWRGIYKQTFPDKGWEIKDGVLTIHSSNGQEEGLGGDIITEKEYSAFELQFDFKLTEGANSGVKYFVKETYDSKGKSGIGLEYQVLDDEQYPDAKLGSGDDRTLSSLYDLIARQDIPNAFKKIGEWNHGKIIVYPNNHVKHWLNGYKMLEYEKGSK